MPIFVRKYGLNTRLRVKFCYNPTGHVSAGSPALVIRSIPLATSLEISLMKLFRVGSCLALLMAGVACSQAPKAATAPSATSAAHVSGHRP